MSKTLTASIPTLQKDIFDCAKEAMYEAFMTTINSDGADPRIAAAVKKNADIAAQKYASKFAEKISPKMARAIYDFVKEISITLIPAGSLIAPQAPTGSLPVTGTSSTEIGDITVK